MDKIILYHGTPDKLVTPTFGRGFYLTEDIQLAKEWAVCRPNNTNGYVHKFELDAKELKILNFEEYNTLAWLAELMKHRDAAVRKIL